MILDGPNLAEWQVKALDGCGGKVDSFWICRNAPTRKIGIRHVCYYALKLISSPANIKLSYPISKVFPDVEKIDFSADDSDGWQALPIDMLTALRSRGVDFIVKMGMGLLRIPPEGELGTPILSYHHGDPHSFRGRPACFWEMQKGISRVGQVVQVLENRLDAGRIAAIGFTKIQPHSFKKTLRLQYDLSPHLLRQALRNLRRERCQRGGQGKNYRLPGNLVAISTALKIAKHMVAHLLYGLFVEKRWRVFLTPQPEADAPSNWDLAKDAAPLPLPPGYTFLADPFQDRSGQATLLCEGLEARSGRGKIIAVADESVSLLDIESHHCSYPFSFTADGKTFILPEVTSSMDASCLELEGTRIVAVHPLTIDRMRKRLLDPTIFEHENSFYLFANDKEEGEAILRLWVADNALGPYTLHPSGIIRMDPVGSRMAGSILRLATGEIFRFGQVNDRRYGDGVVAFRVCQLSPDHYSEEEAGTINLPHLRGPHHIDAWDGRIAFDGYHEAFSLLAGVRRLGNRLGRARGQ